MIELSRTEKAAQTRARKKGRGYVGPTHLRHFFDMKGRSCKAFRKVRVLSPDNPGHVRRMIDHLEWIETFGYHALEPMERRVLAHLRGEPIPLPDEGHGCNAIGVGSNQPVERALRRAA